MVSSLASIYDFFIGPDLFIDSNVDVGLFCLYLVIKYFFKLFILYLFKTCKVF